MQRAKGNAGAAATSRVGQRNRVLRTACANIATGTLESLENRQLLTVVIDWQAREGTGAAIADDAGDDQPAQLWSGASWTTARAGASDPHAVSLDGLSNTLATPELLGYLGSTASLSFWIQTTQRGNDNPALAPAVAGIGDLGDAANIFWGFLDGSGRIGLNVPGTPPAGGKATVKSTLPVNDGNWHHVSMSRDTFTGEIRIFVDGFLNDSGIANSSPRLTGSIIDLGLVRQADPSPDTYLAAQLDQIRIDDAPVTAAEVGQMFNPSGQAPATPANLAVSYAGARAVRLSWTPSPNTSFYEVYRRVTGSGDAFVKTPANASGSSFFDTGLTPTTSYDYYIVAVNPAGSSQPSNTVTATTIDQAPQGTGTGLLGIYYDDDGGPEAGRGGDTVAFNSTGRIAVRTDPNIAHYWTGQPHPSIDPENFTVNWTGELEAQYSEPYTFFKQSDDGFIMDIEIDGQWVSVFSDYTYHGVEAVPGMASLPIELQAGQRYKIRAETFDGCCDAGAFLRWSSPSTPTEVIPQSQFYPPATPATAPAAPNGLFASPGFTPNTLSLNWNDSSDNELGFIIRRSTTGGAGSFFEIARTAAGTFTDFVFPGAAYHYEVIAFNLRGESAASNPASATADGVSGTGLFVEYYNQVFDQQGTEPSITAAASEFRLAPDVNWAEAAPLPGVTIDNFTNVWEGRFIAPETGTYRLSVRSDDGMYVWIDDTLVHSDPTYHGMDPAILGFRTFDLVQGQSYYMRFRSWDGCCGAGVDINWSTPSSAGAYVDIPDTIFTSITAPLTAPAAMDATNVFGRKVTLNWGNVPGERIYMLERATQASFADAQLVGQSGFNQTSFTDTTVQPGQTYYYRVRAAGLGGHSPFTSLPVLTTLADEPVAEAPTNLVASRGNNFVINLRWQDNSLNETGFRIERKVGAGGTYATVGNVGENVTTFSDAEAKTEGETYFYRVTAINAEDEASAFTNEASAVATVNTLPAPWQHQQVGGGTVGDAVYDAATQSYRITGGGSDIWNNSDEFHYMYQEVTGDFVITTRVKEQIRTHEWSKAGPEIREKLIGPSRHVGLFATGDHDPEFNWRQVEAGGPDNRRPYNSTDLNSPMWLRIARVGDTFFGWTSLDGANYVAIDTDAAAPGIQGLPLPNNQDYPDTMYVGLAVSGVGGTFGDATFDQVDLQLVTAPVPASNVAAAAMSGNRAFIQWASSPGELGAQVERREGPTGAWLPVGTELYGGTGEYIDTGLTPGVQYSYRVVSRNSKGAAAPSAIATITSTAGSETLPSPWQTADVGVVGFPGSATVVDNAGEAGDVFTLNGGGVDIWSNNDEFRFVYQELTGDFTITTRMLSQERTAEWSKAGLDARESLTNNARHVGIFATGDHDPEYAIRPEVDAQTTNVRPRNSWNIDAPTWMRIQRVGDNFKAWTSGDGVNWLPVDTNGAVAGHQGYDLDLPDTIFVGLAVSAVNDAEISTAEFDNVIVESGSVVPGIVLTGTAANDNWYLKRVGDQVHVWNNADGSGAAASQHPLGESLTVDGLDGDDTVTIDMSGGDFDLASLTINGANGADQVSLANGAGRVLTLGAAPALNGETLDLGVGGISVTGGDVAAIEAVVAGGGILTSSDGDYTGVAVVPTDSGVFVRYSYDGDATGDGFLDADDYFRIDSGFANQPASPTYAQGDFNFDDRIDADDYFRIDSAFANQGAPVAAAAAAPASSATVVVEEEKKSIRKRAPVESLFSAKKIRKRGSGRGR